jgi:hypothetical protein
LLGTLVVHRAESWERARALVRVADWARDAGRSASTWVSSRGAVPRSILMGFADPAGVFAACTIHAEPRYHDYRGRDIYNLDKIAKPNWRPHRNDDDC